MICVTPNNNNKFYNMEEVGDGTFKVEYGRVGAEPTRLTYQMYDWDKKYREKLKQILAEKTFYGDINLKDINLKDFKLLDRLVKDENNKK